MIHGKQMIFETGLNVPKSSVIFLNEACFISVIQLIKLS